MNTNNIRTTSKQRTICFMMNGMLRLSSLASMLLNVNVGYQLFILQKFNEKIFIGTQPLPEDKLDLCNQYCVKLHADYILTRLEGKCRPLARDMMRRFNATKSITLNIKIIPTNIGRIPFHEVLLDNPYRIN